MTAESVPILSEDTDRAKQFRSVLRRGRWAVSCLMFHHLDDVDDEIIRAALTESADLFSLHERDEREYPEALRLVDRVIDARTPEHEKDKSKAAWERRMEEEVEDLMQGQISAGTSEAALLSKF